MLSCLFPRYIKIGELGSRIKNDGSLGKRVTFLYYLNPEFRDGIPTVDNPVNPLDEDYQTVVNAAGEKFTVIPCGQCLNCRRNRAFRWKTRILMELDDYEPDQACFLTLTYDDDHIPDRGLLRYKDVQDFLKKLRESVRRDSPDTRLRFFTAAEYGEQTSRPHYHLAIFGYDFFDDNRADVLLTHYSHDMKPLYTNSRISDCWDKGIAEFAELSEGSASYIAGYCVKKLEDAAAVGKSIQPFIRMSLKPALGSRYLSRHLDEILATESYSFRGQTRHLDRFSLRVLLKEGIISEDDMKLYSLSNQSSLLESLYDRQKNTDLPLKELDRYLAEDYNKRKKTRDTY